MYRKRSLSNFILLALEKTIDGYARFEDFAYHPYRYQYMDVPVKKRELAQAIKRLRENGLIDFVDDEKIAMKLTDKGREKAVLAKLLQDGEKWDGKWRIIMFDVPEKRRLARDLLRLKLKSWGFIPFQRSVWITKKNCTKPLRDFINQAGINDWVKVFEANKID